MTLTAQFFAGGHTNLAPDPRFESGAFTGAHRVDTALSGVSHRHGVSALDALEGEFSLRMAWTGSPAASQVVGERGHYLPVAPGDVLSVGVDVGYARPAGVFGELAVDFVDASLAPVGATSVADSPAGQLEVSTLALPSLAAPAGAAFARVRMLARTASSGSTTDGQVVFDRLLVVEEPTLCEFFDGDEPLCTWNGPRFFSSSTQVGESELIAHLREVAPPIYFEEPAL